MTSTEVLDPMFLSPAHGADSDNHDFLMSVDVSHPLYTIVNVCKESSTRILRKTSGRELDNVNFPAILVLHFGMRLASSLKETRTSTDGKRAQPNAELVVQETYLSVTVQYGDKSTSRMVHPWRH